MVHTLCHIAQNSNSSKQLVCSFIDSPSYINLIQSYAKPRFLVKGKQIHGRMIVIGFRPSLFLLNNLLNMYCKCGDMDSSRILFERMLKRNVVSWNSLISGYSQIGLHKEAINAFMDARAEVIKLDRFTYSCALNVCAQTGDLAMAKIVHGLIVVGGFWLRAFLTNSLIDMYSRCGRMDYAKFLFDNAKELDNVSWNSLIAGYARIGLSEETLRIFVRMHQGGWEINNFALGSVLGASSAYDDWGNFGKVIHAFVKKIGLDANVVVGGALLDMYCKTKRLDDAIKVFKLMPNQNVVAFNAMIAGFFRLETENCDEFVDEALGLFSEIHRRGMRPTKFTFSSMLRACNVVEAFEHGKQIHAQIFKNNIQLDKFIGSSLIELYSKLGSMEDAWRCFNSIPMQDIISWTSMIAGCARNGQFEHTLTLFHESFMTGSKPDKFTISCVLVACANLALTKSGEQIQGYAFKIGCGHFTIVGNSQICMYAKSGDIDSAYRVFKEMENHDVVSWSVMISSHAQHGCAIEALRLFTDMESCGVAPNQVTFLGVLTACSHAGLVDEGLRHFKSMKKDYNIDPNIKHLTCVVDLLGRAGRLVDAECFIATSGFENDPVMWRTLLGACRVHGNMDMGQTVANRVIELEPQVAASYVLLYNMYLDAGKQLPANKVRDMMKERRIKKEPGLSWIEIRKSVHSFVAGDRSHPQSHLIYAKLEEILKKIKKMGYAQIEIFSFEESDEEHKEYVVNYHSEKLAVALGIIALPKSAPIRVMKNLRVCGDCHTTMKFLSKIEEREIILRDSIRFHHLRGGSCSCGDYW